jgi:hypothetical protein
VDRRPGLVSGKAYRELEMLFSVPKTFVYNKTMIIIIIIIVII